MNNFDNKINDILQEIVVLNEEKQNKYGYTISDTDENNHINNNIEHNVNTDNVKKNECNDKCRPLIELQFREYKIKKNKNSENSENNEDTIIDNINDFLDKELENIYNRPWNKLELSLKNNRINNYVINLKEQYKLQNKDIENINILLKEQLSNGRLNKKTDVEYDTIEGKILNIKNFIIDTNENGEIIYHFAEISKKKKKGQITKKNTELNKIKKLQSSNNKKIQEEYLSQKKILGIDE